MITLRTLKKKSKQAVPILVKHYGLTPQAFFLAERGVNYHEFVIRCTHGAGNPSRVTGRPHCACTSHPLKGTPMTGGMSGGEEPEWDESTALGVLIKAVMWNDRPETMTDREWDRTLAISGSAPVDIAAMLAELNAEDGVQ